MTSNCPRNEATSASCAPAYVFTRLLPYRSPAAWDTQENDLGAYIFCSSSQHITCWAPNLSAFALLGSLKYLLGNNLVFTLPRTCVLCARMKELFSWLMSSQHVPCMQCVPTFILAREHVTWEVLNSRNRIVRE